MDPQGGHPLLQGEGQAQPLAWVVSQLHEDYKYAPHDTLLLTVLRNADSAGAGAAVDAMVQYLSDHPIHPHPEQIVDAPAALFAAAAAGPDLRTGNSIYFMTTVMPLLASPDGGWKWRAGCRRTVRAGDVVVGVRADYRFIGGAGGGIKKCSMFVYSIPGVEGLMIVKFVRRD